MADKQPVTKPIPPAPEERSRILDDLARAEHSEGIYERPMPEEIAAAEETAPRQIRSGVYTADSVPQKVDEARVAEIISAASGVPPEPVPPPQTLADAIQSKLKEFGDLAQWQYAPHVTADGVYHCPCGAHHGRGPCDAPAPVGTVYRCLKCGNRNIVERNPPAPAPSEEPAPQSAEIRLKEICEAANDFGARVKERCPSWFDEPRGNTDFAEARDRLENLLVAEVHTTGAAAPASSPAPQASPFAEILAEELKNPEYASGYAEGLLDATIAAQLKVLRKQRGWTQAEMGEKIGTKQSGYARIEDCNYGRWNVETLRKCADAFGLRLKITFEDFSEVATEVEAFSAETLQRPAPASSPVREAGPKCPKCGNKKITVNFQEYKTDVERADRATCRKSNCVYSGPASEFFPSPDPEGLAGRVAESLAGQFGKPFSELQSEIKSVVEAVLKGGGA